MTKNDDLRAMTSKLRVTEAEVTQRATALSNAQQQLGELSEQQSTQLLRMDELHVSGSKGKTITSYLYFSLLFWCGGGV